ncbi:MAG: desulfoferrodoxin [Spirochaetaceae bacterium]|jgi:superoxide reductase|nr:desulfoferrodoxin [Spirochaetaceae bacterium]
MTKVKQVYKCPHCGNVIEILNAGSCVPVCCGQEMSLMAENTTDAAKEKHVPVIEKIDGGYKVKVGEVAHPMEDKHYIQWIELVADGFSCRKFLKPGDTPEATFCCCDAKEVSAREYCNLHGLWKA